MNYGDYTSDDDEECEDPEADRSEKVEIPPAYEKEAVAFWRNVAASGSSYKLFFITHIYYVLSQQLQLLFFFLLTSKRKRRSFQTVRNKFKLLKHERQLYVWEKAVIESKLRRFKEINEYVLERFKAGLEKGAIIHDRDLRRWAIRGSNRKFEIQSPVRNSVHHVTGFGNSKRETRLFRENNQITSFVRKSLEIIHNYMPKNIFNTDQCGINYELVSGRTLDISNAVVENGSQRKNIVGLRLCR